VGEGKPRTLSLTVLAGKALERRASPLLAPRIVPSRSVAAVAGSAHLCWPEQRDVQLMALNWCLSRCGGHVELGWPTASCIAERHVDVERSGDGQPHVQDGASATIDRLQRPGQSISQVSR
jgi:hypothetical protein